MGRMSSIAEDGNPIRPTKHGFLKQSSVFLTHIKDWIPPVCIIGGTI